MGYLFLLVFIYTVGGFVRYFSKFNLHRLINNFAIIGFNIDNNSSHLLSSSHQFLQNAPFVTL